VDIDDIPHDATKFPVGVSEHVYPSWDLMSAFLDGLHLADDVDVEQGQVFERDDKFVVRVRVGDFFDEPEDWNAFVQESMDGSEGDDGSGPRPEPCDFLTE